MLGRFPYHALGSGLLPPHPCLLPKLELRPWAHRAPTSIRISSVAGQSTVLSEWGSNGAAIGHIPQTGSVGGMDLVVQWGGHFWLGDVGVHGPPIIHGIARRKFSLSVVGVYGIGIAPTRAGVGPIRDHSRGITSKAMSRGVTSK